MTRTHGMTSRASKVLRIACPIGIFAVCAWALAPHFAAQSLDGIFSQLRAVTWPAWLAAASLSIISLWSVGRYDGVAHRHFATGIADHRARWSGTIAISLGQTLGFGLFTSAFARWRMLPDISLATSLKLSAFVSFSFVLSWAVVLGVACAFLPAPAWIKPLAFTILAIIPAAIWLTFRHPVLHLARYTARLPSLLSAGAIVLWTTVDTVAAGAVLFVLLPHGTEVSFAQFLPLFLLALGTALLSNTPGGVGPFELMMIGLFPHLPAGDVLVSILAFRIVYYACPAIFAGVALIMPFAASPLRSSHPQVSLKRARNAELGIIKQNGGRTLQTRDGACAIWPTGQTLTALCDPIQGSASATLSALHYEAKSTGCLPMVYKCSAQTAASARQNGWSVMHVSDDALIDPQVYAPNAPSARQLRRKLRAAEKSGLSIEWSGALPWSDMARVDAIWQSTHSTARGGTMGRFERGYLSDHLIVRGYVKGALVAFATFQRSTQEWCLDVMRHTDAAPDGTMHALVHQAVICARHAAIGRVSLAAVPACPDPNSAIYRWAARIAVTMAGGTGLRQFKSAFSPHWTPRYAASPNPVTLAIGLVDIAREVRSPAPIAIRTEETAHEIHNSDENYELASRRAS